MEETEYIGTESSPSQNSTKYSHPAHDGKRKKRDFISRGESVHKWSTYLGVDWAFNTLSGVTFSYFAKYSEPGKKYWTEPLTTGFKKLLGYVIKNEESLQKSAERGTSYVSIIAGGMFTIPPLLILENNKIRKKLTQFYDRIIYGKDEVKNDPRFQKAYDEIEYAPKKDFFNGMLSRCAALVPLLTIATLEKPRAIANHYWFNHFENASKWVATKVLKLSPATSFKNLPLKEAQKRWDYIHKEGIALDFGSGMPYAIMHAFFYNMFVNHKNNKADAASKTDEDLGDKVLHAIEELPEKGGMIPVVPHAERETKRRAVIASNEVSHSQSYGLGV